MISKRIGRQNPRSSSMRRLVQYITSPQGTISRVGEVMITNCNQADDPNLAAVEIESTQGMNKRSKEDKTYHLLVSFRAGEEPDEKALRVIEREMCAALGYSEHQRIAVVHRDTDNIHMHIAINKVHPETFRMHQPFCDFLKLRSARAKLEKRFALSVDTGEKQQEHHSKARDMEAFSEMESLESWIRRECLPDLQKAESWETFHQTLAESGLAIAKRGNGLVLQTTEGEIATPVKASSVDRALSKKKLEEKFGVFAPRADSAAITAKRCYTKGHAPSLDAESLTLFDEYKRLRNANENRQNAELSALDKEYAQRSAAYKALHQGEIKTIKSAKWASAKKLEYQTAKLEHRTRMLKLNQEIRERRKKVYVECGKCTWLDWLRSQAEAGREDAVQALRKRAHGLNKKFNAPSITGEAEHSAPVLEEGQIDKVTKKGTIMYQVGRELVRHDAEGYSVAYASSLDTTVMALQMARKRFGKALTVTGGTDFKGKVIAAAVAAQLDITFTDARMETQRKQLLEQRKEEQTRLEKQQSQKNER